MNRIWETISTAPAEAWVGLIGVIFGSLLAILTAWLTNSANRQQLKMQMEHEEKIHRQRASKERLEELFLLVVRWEGLITADTLFLAHGLKGDYGYKDYLDNVQKNQAKNASFEFMRIELIVGVYEGDIGELYKTALTLRDKLNRVKEKPMSVMKSGKVDRSLIDPLLEADRAFSEAAKNLKQAIVKAVKQL